MEVTTNHTTENHKTKSVNAITRVVSNLTSAPAVVSHLTQVQQQQHSAALQAMQPFGAGAGEQAPHETSGAFVKNLVQGQDTPHSPIAGATMEPPDLDFDFFNRNKGRKGKIESDGEEE